MNVLHRSVLVVCVAAMLAACGNGSSAEGPSQPTTAGGSPTPSTPTEPTTTTPPAGPFVSTLYGYSVAAPGWTGKPAATPWDGMGSPGNGDATVDLLFGPFGRQVAAFGEPTGTTLTKFVAALRKTNVTAHQCPLKAEATHTIAIDGNRAILDEEHCPPGDGVFALTAYLVHAGRAFVLFTFSAPGHEASMRAWFRAFLRYVSLTK